VLRLINNSLCPLQVKSATRHLHDRHHSRAPRPNYIKNTLYSIHISLYAHLTNHNRPRHTEYVSVCLPFCFSSKARVFSTLKCSWSLIQHSCSRCTGQHRSVKAEWRGSQASQCSSSILNHIKSGGEKGVYASWWMYVHGDPISLQFKRTLQYADMT
jgi:hypothetical protein